LTTFPTPLLPVRRPTRWHVGFTDVDDSGHWLRWFLRWLPHPRHVRAFRQASPCDRCGHVGPLIVVEQTLSRLSVTDTPGATEASHTAEIEAAGGHVVVVTVPAETGGWTPRLGNCIATTRALLALRPRVQTAGALLRELRDCADRVRHGR
jgi:hypothetical protein